MDNLLLEKTKEVIYFVKKCWNFNSAKFLEKIKQTKSDNFELIFYVLIYILDLFIILPIIISIFILYTIYLIIYYFLGVLISISWESTIELYDFLLQKLYSGRDLSCIKELFYWILSFLYIIIFFPLIYSLTFVIYMLSYFIYYHFIMTRILVGNIIEFYIDDYVYGFYNAIDSFLAIIYVLFLIYTGIDVSKFIYVICRINIKYKKSTIRVKHLLDNII